MITSTEPVALASKEKHYITVMLNQLVEMAKERDAMLAYFITMAAVQSADIDSGAVKAKPIESKGSGQAPDEVDCLSKVG